MWNFFSELNLSLRIFNERKYFYLFIVFTLLSIVLYTLVPVYTIPGNDLQFWLSILTPSSYIVLFTFSIALGLLLAMKIYEFNHIHSAFEKTKNTGGIVAVILAGLYSTAACGACISSLFAFAGAGGALFLNKYRDAFMLFSIFITIFAIHLSAKNINSRCEECIARVT